ncbi:MAG: ATP-binding cassette domain-containing protein [Ruminococcus sp.]|nr:ATP-binding cassette domain-containing protein [Ruminococcus sp.]
MNSEPVVKFENVCKTYTLYKNDQERFRALFKKPKNPILHKALDHVSLEIHKGEAVGIMGDNGCGKSTLLKTITGVTFPDEGSVTVHGMVAALLELTSGFSAEMTGRENIYLKGYILGLDDDQIKVIEENVVDFAELGDYIDQPVRTYSSGMKMRLGFSINVNISPDILVVDEALAVGDAAFKAKCKNKIREIIETGVTVLYVSHNASSVEEICERSVYMKKGHIIFDGPTHETHLVYLVDKRQMMIKKRERRIKKLEELIATSDNKEDIIAAQSVIPKHKDAIERLKQDLAQYEQELKEYREEHYSNANQ